MKVAFPRLTNDHQHTLVNPQVHLFPERLAVCNYSNCYIRTAVSPHREEYFTTMDGFQLPEETAEDRVLAATEFLDPSKSS